MRCAVQQERKMQKQGNTNPGETGRVNPTDSSIDHLAMFAAGMEPKKVVAHCNRVIQETSGTDPEEVKISLVSKQG